VAARRRRGQLPVVVASAPTAIEPRSRNRLRLPASTGTWLFAAFYVVIATALQLARQPGFPSWNTIWQEDGGIFLNQALSESFPHALVHSYNSYLHVGPRLVAEVASWFPLDYAAKILSGGECVAVSVMSVYVYFTSGAVVRAQWARMAIAGSMILLPAAGYETNAVLSDMHWYLTFTAFWAIAAYPRDRRGVVLASIVVALAVLSDPFTGLFLPFALFQAWRRRGERFAWVVPIVFGVSMAIQLGFGLFSEPAGRYAASHWSDIPGVYALRVTGSLFVGDQNLHSFWLASWGWVFIFVTLALMIAIVVYALRRWRELDWRLFIGQCFVYSVLYLTVPCMLRGTENFLNRSIYSLNGSRYMPLPILFLVAIVVAVLDRRDPKVSVAGWRKIQWAVGLWAAFLVLNNFSIVTTRSPGPPWDDNLYAARLKCEGKVPQETNASVSGPVHPSPHDKITIYISPNVQPPLWAVIARCDQLKQ
jgi:hypothetical protein